MSISQQEAKRAKYRESVIKYAKRYGTSATLLKFNISRRTLSYWKKSYKKSGDNYKALINKSRRPISHPNTHTPEEIKLIQNLLRRNPSIGLQDLWIKLRKRGYSRTLQGLTKTLRRLGAPTTPKRIPNQPARKNSPMRL